jgi:hypothetical protein
MPYSLTNYVAILLLSICFTIFVDAAALSRTVAPRLLVMHLIMSMMQRFDSVMVKHFVKGLGRRMIAHR